ncbi:Panacea domain-containing protein [Orenia marismortui]|uniref:Panacea domain-containing protein n=1 Tax=Orenia marismortui TaxID=46469 RepID=UPI00036EDFD1|nr:type II toxin-antitoxin system antitoxin SocA domain-containing protein [Orenia marismortui]
MGDIIPLHRGGEKMAKITYYDIADYFISFSNVTNDLITNLKLQKLVYYAQAWHVTIFKNRLFEGDFQAWVHGPVLPSLYDDYKKFRWKPIERDDLDEKSLQQIRNKIGEEKTEFMEELIEEYFTLSAYELERLTHEEEPWRKARKGLSPDQPSSREIQIRWMKEYYDKFREI